MQLTIHVASLYCPISWWLTLLTCVVCAPTSRLWHELWNLFNFPYWWNVLFNQQPFWSYCMCILNIVKTNIYPGNLFSKDECQACYSTKLILCTSHVQGSCRNKHTVMPLYIQSHKNMILCTLHCLTVTTQENTASY